MRDKHSKTTKQSTESQPKDDMSWLHQAALEQGRESYELAEETHRSGMLKLARGGTGNIERSDGSWTETAPTKQGLYWHWSGSHDDAPIVLSVIYSGTNEQCFVSAGQYGIKTAIYCESYGGWWAECTPPELPEV